MRNDHQPNHNPFEVLRTHANLAKKVGTFSTTHRIKKPSARPAIEQGRLPETTTPDETPLDQRTLVPWQTFNLKDYGLDPTDPDQERPGEFELGEMVATIREEITQKLADLTEKKEAPESLIASAAFQCFESALVEIIKNTFDANATELAIAIDFDAKNNSVIISCRDNGCGIPAAIAGKYDWEAALLSGSTKKDDASKTGGQKLGLAEVAYELSGQDGHILLSQRKDGTKGTTVSFASSCNPTHELMQRTATCASVADNSDAEMSRPQKMVLAILEKHLPKPILDSDSAVIRAEAMKLFNNPGSTVKEAITYVAIYIRRKAMQDTSPLLTSATTDEHSPATGSNVASPHSSSAFFSASSSSDSTSTTTSGKRRPPSLALPTI